MPGSFICARVQPGKLLHMLKRQLLVISSGKLSNSPGVPGYQLTWHTGIGFSDIFLSPSLEGVIQGLYRPSPNSSERALYDGGRLLPTLPLLTCRCFQRRVVRGPWIFVSNQAFGVGLKHFSVRYSGIHTEADPYLKRLCSSNAVPLENTRWHP